MRLRPGLPGVTGSPSSLCASAEPTADGTTRPVRQENSRCTLPRQGGERAFIAFVRCQILSFTLSLF